jgi:putative lipase involved disintegration of autophagic bodies
MKDVMEACPVLLANAGDWFNITGDNFQTLFEFLGKDEDGLYVFRYMYGEGFSLEDNRVRDILNAWPISLFSVTNMSIDRFIRLPASRLWAFELEN